MAIQNYISAEDWLMDHKDLWENGADGLVFLTNDLSQIPDEVKNYVKMSNDTVDEFMQGINLMNKMSK